MRVPLTTSRNANKRDNLPPTCQHIYPRRVGLALGYIGYLKPNKKCSANLSDGRVLDPPPSLYTIDPECVCVWGGGGDSSWFLVPLQNGPQELWLSMRSKPEKEGLSLTQVPPRKGAVKGGLCRGSSCCLV